VKPIPVDEKGSVRNALKGFRSGQFTPHLPNSFR